jgi:hypothetical protein
MIAAYKDFPVGIETNERQVAGEEAGSGAEGGVNINNS